MTPRTPQAPRKGFVTGYDVDGDTAERLAAQAFRRGQELPDADVARVICADQELRAVARREGLL